MDEFNQFKFNILFISYFERFDAKNDFVLSFSPFRKGDYIQ